MKFMVGLLFCIPLVSTDVSAMTVIGPTPSAAVMQEYELPSGAPADQYFWKQDWIGKSGYYPSAGTYDCAFTNIQQTCTHQSSGSTIKTVLTEKRSGMTYTITVQAYMEPMYYDVDDPSQSSLCGNHRPLNSQSNFVCSPEPWTNSRTLTALITQDEMNKLPIGGVWEGQLKFKFHTLYGGDVVDYQANITLKGKATGKQDIYFPEFNGANPLVQLDLHPTGSVTGNSVAEDTTTLDMCLYDGYNSNSDSMTLSFSDEGRAGDGRKEGDFSIYNTSSSGAAATERIDYHVQMFDPHSKSWRTVKNSDSLVLSAGVNGQDQIRPVRLPSITYPVLCAPAPLRLIVEKFNVAQKMAGYYKGTLRVEFTPSMNSI